MPAPRDAKAFAVCFSGVPLGLLQGEPAEYCFQLVSRGASLCSERCCGLEQAVR
jgi:hypothetical protein